MCYKNDEERYNGTSEYVLGIEQDIRKKQKIGGLSISLSMYQVNAKLYRSIYMGEYVKDIEGMQRL